MDLRVILIFSLYNGDNMTYNTEKRCDLIKYLKSREGNPSTIDEISEAILKDGKGKSTVYRLIASLVCEGSVRKITDERSRRTTYQYIHTGHCAEHLHLKCKICGSMIHIDEETTNAFSDQLFRLHGFSVEAGALLPGVCLDCKSSLGGVKV